MKTQTKMDSTREHWLRQAALKLNDTLLKEQDSKLPEKWQVSVGFPYRSSQKAIGQAWDSKAAEDGAFHMFISPVLCQPVDVLQTLLHEMVHISVGLEHKHKGPFRELCKALGFEGKMTATYAKEGTPLHERLQKLGLELGEYPQGVFNPKAKKRGTGGGGWKRYVSVLDEEFKVLVSPKQVEEKGPPCDYEGTPMVLVED